MTISREWIASRETPRTSWSVIPYSAVSSVRREDYGCIVLSQPGGFAVTITMRALGSLEACELVAEGLRTNPAVAPDAARLLQPYLDAARASRGRWPAGTRWTDPGRPTPSGSAMASRLPLGSPGWS